MSIGILIVRAGPVIPSLSGYCCEEAGPAAHFVVLIGLRQREPAFCYLLLLSYGIPSAFGAREFLDVSARTIREIR